MRFHLQAFLKKREEEELHLFRIQVKRITAFLMLLDQLCPHSKLTKQFSPVKKVFKRAGKLRDRYMLSKLIPVQLSMHKSFRKFQTFADDHKKKMKARRLKIIRKLKPAKRASIQRCYHHQLQQISISLNGVISDDLLHQCRKQIKGLLYNYKPFKDILDMNLNTGYLKALEEAIGKWHDQLIFSYLPEKYAKFIIHTEENDVEVLRSNIKALTPNFYQQALGICVDTKYMKQLS